MAGVNWSYDQLVAYQKNTYGTQNVGNSNVTDPIKSNDNISTDLQAGLAGKDSGTDTTSPEVYPGLGVEKTTTEITQQPVEAEPKQTDAEVAENNQNTELQESPTDTSEGRQLYTRAQRKAAREEAEEQFKQYGTADGQKNIEDVAEKYAKNYVKNEYNRENFENTIVFMDKDDYKAAKKDREEQFDALYERYRNEGYTKKASRQMANAQLPELEYLKKGWFGQQKTRDYIENNRNLFYDENGKFSSEKFKAHALEFANEHTNEGEVTNYHLSLRERREVAQEKGMRESVVKNFAKYSNLGYERDNTNLYKGLAIVTCTAAGVALGPVLGSSAAAAAAASSAAAGSASAGGSSAASNSSSSSAASASVKTNGYGIGALGGFGVGLGLASFIKDKGREDINVYAPGQEPVVPPPKQEEIPEAPCPLTAIDEEIYEEIPEETCVYNLKKGQTLYDAVRDGYGLKSHKEIMKYVHIIKDRYGLNYNVYTPRTEWEMPIIDGKAFNCDVDVKGTCTDFSGRGTTMGTFNRKTEKVQVGTNYFTEDCNGNQLQYRDEQSRNEHVIQRQREVNVWNARYGNK